MADICQVCEAGAHATCADRDLPYYGPNDLPLAPRACFCPICAGTVCASGFHFHEPDHTYWLNGRRLLSVTQIMERTGLSEDYSCIPADVLAAAAERGAAVHRACALLNEDDLDEEQLDPGLLGYLAAYKRFLSESGFDPIGWETPLYDSDVGYAGTPDLFGRLNGWRALIDLKSGSMLSPGPLRIQIHGGYDRLLRLGGIRIDRRFALQLRQDGTYRLIPAEHPMAWPVFSAALSTLRDQATPAHTEMLQAWKDGRL